MNGTDLMDEMRVNPTYVPRMSVASVGNRLKYANVPGKQRTSGIGADITLLYIDDTQVCFRHNTGKDTQYFGFVNGYDQHVVDAVMMRALSTWGNVK